MTVSAASRTVSAVKNTPFMSKRALKKYLEELDRSALQEQILDLYARFPAVKTYYDFVFNPREEKLLQEAQAKIREEYFPRRRKRAKARRSVAQKYIRHFQTLGMDPSLLAELMAYNLETARNFERTRRCNDAFYRSMQLSFRQWLAHLKYHGIGDSSEKRIQDLLEGIRSANWPNTEVFEDLVRDWDARKAD